MRGRIELGLAGKLPDTPKPGDKSLEGVVNLIIAGKPPDSGYCGPKGQGDGL